MGKLLCLEDVLQRYLDVLGSGRGFIMRRDGLVIMRLGFRTADATLLGRLQEYLTGTCDPRTDVRCSPEGLVWRAIGPVTAVWGWLGALVETRPALMAPEEMLLDTLAETAYLLVQQDELVARAVAREREELQREMHDGLAQEIGYLAMRLGQWREARAQGREVEGVAELEEVSQVAQQLYEHVREELCGLSAVEACTGKPLVHLVADYARAFAERTGIQVETHLVEGKYPDPDPWAKVQMLRILQEALCNVRRHAAATTVRISYSRLARRVELVISDDGCGFDPAQATESHGRFGLASMEERARSINGSLKVFSRPGMGTTVRLQATLGRRVSFGPQDLVS